MKKIHSDLFGTNGNDKIDIDEIGKLENGEMKLLSEVLSDLMTVENNSSGRYIEFENGFKVAIKKVLVNKDIGLNSTAFITSIPISFTDIPFAHVSSAVSVTTGSNTNGLGDVVVSATRDSWALRSTNANDTVNQELVFIAIGF